MLKRLYCAAALIVATAAHADTFTLNAAPDTPGGRGILSTHLHSDGRHHDILYVDGGPSSTGQAGFLRMEGREVFRQAVTRLSEVVDEALAANGLRGTDISDEPTHGIECTRPLGR